MFKVHFSCEVLIGTMTQSSSTTNILHITDLHYKTERAHNQSVILGALLEDIQRQSAKVGEPDLIIFSGDLVHDADDEGIYEKLYDNFIDKLLDAANCDHSRLYLVPGNHDLQRSRVKCQQGDHDSILAHCVNRDTLNAHYFDGKIGKLALEKSKKFFDFQSFFDSEGELFSNEIVQVHDLPEKKVSVVCLNTSWMGQAGLQNASDLRQLLIPEASLVEAFRYVPDDRFVIGVHHHPTNWLTEYCESDFKDYLGGKLDLQLVGHVHDPRPMVFTEASGTTFQNQAGALYTWRDDRYLGYSYIRLAPQTKFIEVCWRSYYDKRRCFDDAINVNDNSGWLFSSEAAKEFFRNYFTESKVRELQDWVKLKLKPYLLEDFERGIIDRPTAELFVPPPLSKKVFVEGKREEDPDEFRKIEVTFDEVSQSSENIILQAYPEHGRTTLLQQLCINACSQGDLSKRARHCIPVFLKFSDFTPGTNRVQKAIRNALPDLPQGAKISSLLQHGVFNLLVDDVVFSCAKEMAELRRFISENKQNRFILSTLILREYDGVDVDVGLPVYFERITMGPFKRKNIRSLVKKWDSPNGSEEELLERIIQELKAINVPYTPVNSTLLLDIISNDHAFSPLNRPALIERFIETLLKKRSLSEVERRKFDFRNQVHYLGHIAEHMCREDCYILSFEDLFRITDEYLKNLGLGYGARNIIENSLSSRIFHDRKPDGSISFRFRAFLEFFAASQMRASADFRNWVFEQDRFLSFLNEIEYYAGLERNDLQLLQLVSERHEAYVKDVFGEKLVELLNSDSHEMVPDSLEANLRYSEELAEQIGEEPMSAAERDEVLDADIPQDAEGRQEVFRPIANSPQSRYILSLMMYTALVKNTELVSDSDKREHLSKVLQSWALTTWGSFLAIPSLVKNRKMNVNGITYVVMYPRDYSDERVAKLISINIPKEIARFLYRLVGTEKLEVQLTQTSLEEHEESRLIEFFRSSLYMDLRFKQWWKVPAQFSQRVRNSAYFQEVMLAKAVDVYRLGAFPKRVEKELQEDIVESYARLYAPSREQMQKLRNKKKVSMERTRLLSSLKAKIDNSKE